MKGGADILSASRVQVSKRRKPISSSSLVTVVPVGTVMERNYRTSSLGPWGLGGPSPSSFKGKILSHMSHSLNASKGVIKGITQGSGDY